MKSLACLCMLLASRMMPIFDVMGELPQVKNVRGPFLIVAPLSVIDNWVREFESWTPHVSMIIYHGDKTIRKNLQADALKGQFNVMLTSYEMVMKDANFMSRLNWVYIIVDEGHRMKNSKSKLTTTLSMKFPSKFRILITGTPLQNNLNELWSLLNFLLPDIFRHDSNFEEWFNSVSIRLRFGHSQPCPWPGCLAETESCCVLAEHHSWSHGRHL